MIYFIQCETGEIKIGYTGGDPQARLETLSVGNPHKLTLLAAMEGGQDHEATLHRLFAAEHVRGEWFKPSEELLGIIRQGCLPFDVKPKPNSPRRIEDPEHCVQGRLLASFLIRQIEECGHADWSAKAKAAAGQAVSLSDARALELAFDLLESHVRAKFGDSGAQIMRTTNLLFFGSEDFGV